MWVDGRRWQSHTHLHTFLLHTCVWVHLWHATSVTCLPTWLTTSLMRVHWLLLKRVLCQCDRQTDSGVGERQNCDCRHHHHNYYRLISARDGLQHTCELFINYWPFNWLLLLLLEVTYWTAWIELTKQRSNAQFEAVFDWPADSQYVVLPFLANYL